MSGAVKHIELLAPAKNLECGMAAVNYGADAVYIGAPKFGARVNAGNALSDIESLAAYAHKYRARVYVTLNTILFDKELDEARSLAFDVFNAGADALIIQDMSLLEMDMPPIPLFASTQTHNVEPDRIKFLETVGIRRVILARELSLAQIREIRSATTIELEAFVHGALCVSFSGQCYFSQASQGRSANRGECAQLCRMKYTLDDGKGHVYARNKHLLSLKDLNLSDHLSGLLEAGITSFKIEGRLKDIDYVKNIVSFYR
ncbi:MAG TPA: peptidase U32 family protein, partial [Bacteroidota bacterium]|nr:peptidase U32 family protein [Bacteroidota bacterium]